MLFNIIGIQKRERSREVKKGSPEFATRLRYTFNCGR